MRTGISFIVSPTDRARLTALIGDRNSRLKHVWRAEIVLLSADCIGTVEIMRRTGKSKTCLWRWQERFAEEGVDGLLRDKTRPSRIPLPLYADLVLMAQRGRELLRQAVQAAPFPNIPPKANRTWNCCFSPQLYRGRNAIERMFGRIKDFRRIATRYDKIATNFLAAIVLAAAVIYWL